MLPRIHHQALGCADLAVGATGPRRSLWAFWILGAILAAWPVDAQAQLGRRLNMGQDGMGQEQILLAPRPLTRLLREGETAIQESRFSDGIEALGTLLLEEPREDLPEDTLHQDYFNEPAQEGYYRSSVRGKALQLLGSIPEEGRKILEIQYGVSARQALSLAVAARNMDAISEVTRKYYHTEAGYDASILLAQDKLIRGYPIAAAGILQRLNAFPAARKRFGAQLAGETAGAWMQAGRMDLAVRVLTEGSKNFPGASISLGGRPAQLGNDQDWPKLLSQVYPKQSTSGARNLENWMMSGGQPDRNGTASAGLPMPIVAWHMSLHRDRSDEETVTSMTNGRQSQNGSPLIPKLEARMIGDIVLAKTASANVFAIDLETGLRKWPFYKDALPVPITSRLQSIPEMEEQFVANSLRNRIWGSSAFGQFTIDTNQLYYITASEDQRQTQPLGLQRTSAPPAHNMLIGVSLQGEGKEMWQVGGAKSPNEPALANAYFLGPPLSFEGDLYALVEINLETRLVVLDSRTGKLQWAQQLTLSPMMPIRSDLLRQSQALTPSISDAVIVCPIGNGAIIAVDLLTRSLLWGKQYQSNATQFASNQVFNFDSTETFDPFEDRWTEPQVIIQNGRVVFTPPETNRIMCLDLLTGESRWDQLRGAARYVAGVHMDKVIVLSNTGVYALNLSDGMPSWGSEVLLSGRTFDSKDREQASGESSNVRGRETLAGKSVRDGQYLFVPTTAQRVLKIDLDAGKLVEDAKVEQPLGNLFAFKNRLISVGATRITAYYTRESLANEVNQRLAANDKDSWALNQKSLLLTADGKVDEAIELLRKSYAIDPKNGETRYLLVDALLSGLENNFDRYLPLATEFEPIIESQRFRFLVVLARGNLQAGQYELAFNRLMELVRERSAEREPGLQSRMQAMTVGPNHQVDIDTWISVQLGTVFDKSTPELQKKMLATIEERMQATAKSHPLARQTELRFLKWLEAAQPSILAVASTMLGGPEQTKAERMLQPVLHSRNAELRQQAAELLKRNAEADDKAMLAYGLMAGDDPDTPTSLEAGPPTPTVRPLPLSADKLVWPAGMIEAKVSANAGPVNFNQVRIRNTSNRYGRSAVELSLTNDHLIVSNSLGHPIANCVFEGNEMLDGMLRGQVDGGLVLLESLGELVAIDMYRTEEADMDPLLWRYSLSRVPTSPRKQHAPAVPVQNNNVLGMRTYMRGAEREAIIGPVTPAGIVIQKDTEVILLDVMTGLPIWSRGGYDATTTLVAHGLEIAIVRSENAKIDILDCRDGSLLRQVQQAEPWKPLCAAGKHLVQFKEKMSVRKGGIHIETPDSCDVRLLDALTGNVLVETSFAPNTRAEACADHFFVAIEESGRLWYCNIATGQVVEHMLDKQPKLQHVRVQAFGDRLVVWTSLQNVSSSANIVVKPDTDDAAMNRGLYAINGSIIALEAETGKMLWDRAGTLHRFVFNTAQPRHTPFIGFFRIVGIGNGRSAQVAVVDLRDGTLAYGNTNLPFNGQNNMESSEFAMRVDPARKLVLMSVGTTVVGLKVTDVEKPPQPVCSFGSLGTRKQVGQPFAPLK